MQLSFRVKIRGPGGPSGKSSLSSKGQKSKLMYASMATERWEKEEQKPKREMQWAKIVERFCRQMGVVAG